VSEEYLHIYQQLYCEQASVELVLRSYLDSSYVLLDFGRLGVRK
jgi:hypothetical protein